MDSSPSKPLASTPRYLRTKEAARLVGLCARTLEKHRTYGTGPKYSKIGGRVLYLVADLQAWIEAGIRTSTSDPHAIDLPPAKPHARKIPYAGKGR